MNRNIIYLILIIVGSLITISPAVVGIAFGDITCRASSWPMPPYICNDGKYFFSYSAMDAYYTPEKTLVPDSTYLYVDGGQTEGLSGI